jgi:hypothetical protein
LADYVKIVDDIFELSDIILCIQAINLFGERMHYRITDKAIDQAGAVNFLQGQFDHIVDNSIYLNLEQFIFTIFDHNGFKTMVVNFGEYSLVIALQKKAQVIEFLCLIEYLFDKLL